MPFWTVEFGEKKGPKFINIGHQQILIRESFVCLLNLCLTVILKEKHFLFFS